MKKIIYRNIAIDCIKNFLLTILTIGVIIWVLQAVNYLDFVIEDGHGFMVYFNYTLLSLPKIFSRVFPFVIFIIFSYTFLKFEDKNELVIFWNFGIKKINFINFFLRLSLCFVILSIILNSIIVPMSQDKARSFLRTSDLDFFGNILKPRKFVDTIRNLTIYFDEKDETGLIKKIFLSDQSTLKNSQITVAKTARLSQVGTNKILTLYDGKTINTIDGKSSVFEFSKTNYNISKYTFSTTTYKKTQETSTLDLIKCSLYIENNKKNPTLIKDPKIINCRMDNLKNIYKELYSRIVKPLYIVFLLSISLLFILKSKNDHKYKTNKITIYILGFAFIIFLESSSKFITLNLTKNLFVSMLPIILISMMYLFFYITLKTKKNENIH